MTGHSDPAELRARMVKQVLADDDVARWSPAVAPWQAALETVPRHEFIPDTIWVKNPGMGPTLVPLHRADDPERWVRLSYRAAYDSYVVTQIDDGHPDGPGLGGSMPTSSASSPMIVTIMLAALDTRPGHRVLEIGTGTGYNAALLAHRLGADHVTSIEIDPEVAATAGRALSATGYGDVCTVVGEGALGYAPNAPYDRVIATAAVRTIPYSWVEQTRPAGRVLVPWANSFADALVALTVDEHRHATGAIVGESSFMWLRTQRERRGAVAAVVEDEDQATHSVTDLHPYWIGGDHGARFAIGQRVPDCQWRYWPYDTADGVGALWLLDFGSRSWAKVTHCTPDISDCEFPVRQHGPRRLWDEVTAAHQWWVERGKPSVDSWRFTVAPDGQRIELVNQ